MKVLTPKEMKRLDRWAIQKLGIPQIALMENAGRAVAEEVSKSTKKQKVCIVAYKGNNGGDGFVAARHVRNQGHYVTVFLCCEEKEISGSAKINLDILKKLKVPIVVKGLNKLEKLLKGSDVVVDAIFGIGLSGEIEGLPAKAIDLINKYKKKRGFCVIAVDVPSGINATSGKVAKHSIIADLTVTFAYPKTGLLKYPAVKNVGRLIVADIGIPFRKPRRLAAGFRPLNVEFFLPKRLVWTHKGDYGRVLIVAGSSGMLGAGILASRAALKSGSGLVYWAVPSNLKNIANRATPEVIVISYEEIKDIKADVVAIGPGVGQSKEILELLHKLVIGHWTLVIDADALNLISKNPDILHKLPKNCVLTPHPGEMSRLTGKSVKEIQKNRERTAQSFARKFGVEVVLKGAYTIVANGKKLSVNSSGNPGMAKAGVGDVLTGIIASFTAQGLKTEDAVYIHGLAGDLAKKDKGEYGLIASDIIGKLPQAILKAQSGL